MYTAKQSAAENRAQMFAAFGESSETFSHVSICTRRIQHKSKDA